MSAMKAPPATEPDFGTRLLLARRLLERGVRFVSVYSGGGPLVTQWEAHDDVNANHERMCGHVDQPIAALLKDLKRRDMGWPRTPSPQRF